MLNTNIFFFSFFPRYRYRFRIRSGETCVVGTYLYLYCTLYVFVYLCISTPNTRENTIPCRLYKHRGRRRFTRRVKNDARRAWYSRDFRRGTEQKSTYVIFFSFIFEGAYDYRVLSNENIVNTTMYESYFTRSFRGTYYYNSADDGRYCPCVTRTGINGPCSSRVHRIVSSHNVNGPRMYERNFNIIFCGQKPLQCSVRPRKKRRKNRVRITESEQSPPAADITIRTSNRFHLHERGSECRDVPKE